MDERIFWLQILGLNKLADCRLVVGFSEEGLAHLEIPLPGSWREPQATVEQLKGLPPTLLLVDEADVLRDEGEAYAAKLRLAGVPVTTVRYDGTCHDFMLLNVLSQTRATRAAISQATAFLRQALHSA